MFSFKSIVLIAAAFTISAECSGVPAIAAAPLVAPAAVGYAHAVPQNIPPYAAQVSVFNRALNPLIAAPYAAPLTAPLAPYAAAAPYVTGPTPVLPGPYAAQYAAPYAAQYAAPYALPAPAAYAAPYPYAAAAPLVRAPYGLAPAFVR